MKKTDIATLVQIERHRDFARFRASELAAVDAVNTGKHGKLQAPLEKPTDEKLFEAFTVGESANYWGQFFSKRLTLNESAGLLMALDPSKVELAAHVVGGKIPEKNWPSSLIAVKLVKAFRDMRGHVEVALQKKDLFADSDGKYGPGDLITWAKENGCVADEVLEAWEAYQAEAGEAEQETAPATPDAVQPEPHTPRVECHTTKGKRSDTLTPVIEHAQSLCKSLKQDEWDTAEVWGKLHTLTAEKYTVLMHLEGDAVVYTDGDKTKQLTKKMLGDRLRGMRKRQANAA